MRKPWWLTRALNYVSWENDNSILLSCYVSLILSPAALVNSSIVPSIDHELFYQHTMTGSIRNSTTNTPEE